MVHKAHKRRIKLFKDLIKDKDIQEVIGVPKKDGIVYSNIKVLDVKTDLIKISIKYAEKEDFNRFPNIPFDISCEINSYLGNYVNLELSMVIKENYPFYPVLWVLEKISTSYNHKSITKYYSTKIFHYNKKMQDDWCLVNMFDMEILSLYVMLGDFKLLSKSIYQ
jgi:hypothetical protein